MACLRLQASLVVQNEAEALRQIAAVTHAAGWFGRGSAWVVLGDLNNAKEQISRGIQVELKRAADWPDDDPSLDLALMEELMVPLDAGDRDGAMRLLDAWAQQVAEERGYERGPAETDPFWTP